MKTASLFNHEGVIKHTTIGTRKPKERDWTPEKQEKIDICLNCTEEKCKGYCPKVGGKG